MREFDTITWICLIILLVGGINWGLVGLVDLNLISAIFGYWLSRLIFIIVGGAAGYICYQIYLMKKRPV